MPPTPAFLTDVWFHAVALTDGDAAPNAACGFSYSVDRLYIDKAWADTLIVLRCPDCKAMVGNLVHGEQSD